MNHPFYISPLFGDGRLVHEVHPSGHLAPPINRGLSPVSFVGELLGPLTFRSPVSMG